MGIPLCCDLVNDRLADALNRIECITNRTVRNGKSTFPFIDVRRQDLYSHIFADHNILRHFGRIINHRREQRRHKLHWIIIF